MTRWVLLFLGIYLSIAIIRFAQNYRKIEKLSEIAPLPFHYCDGELEEKHCRLMFWGALIVTSVLWPKYLLSSVLKRLRPGEDEERS